MSKVLSKIKGIKRRRLVKNYVSAFLAMLLCWGSMFGQVNPNVFQPFTWEWPTPNESRLASGAPGPAYWQQKADYLIKATLDEEQLELRGSETITYSNNSPHTLNYLWVQLDQNKRDLHSLSNRMAPGANYDNWMEMLSLDQPRKPFDGGYTVSNLKDGKGKSLKYTVVETNMRIDLPKPLEPGQSIEFSLDWKYKINDATVEGRSGYEFFQKDKNYIFEIAQWFPRMCVYTDAGGWQNKPFLGPAEFALEFGDYEVHLTVPADHIVAGTGVLQNPEDVLSKEQQKRWEKAQKQVGEPNFIVTPEEATANEAEKASGTKTWKFKAENVRDFAFGSSRKFIWDAATVEIGGKKVLAQSIYPKEALGLWDVYATHVVMHTLDVYSRFSVDYPYPQATAIHGAVWGMEYPMISFCGGRPNPDGTYTYRVKYAMIGVIIHEVGHNFFPMIVNSDERNWAWMDEGLNSFLEYLTEQEWEPGFPSRRGPTYKIVRYLKTRYQNPIMTNAESVIQNGNTSYAKTATGLNMLRNSIMGPRVFDMAFKEYARRWAFKHPEPADFFRTMEDASGMELDWFWRSWFYGMDPVDIALLEVQHRRQKRVGRKDTPPPSATLRDYSPDEPVEFYVDNRPELNDKFTGKGETGTVDASFAFQETLHEQKAQIDEKLGEEEATPEKEDLGGLHVYSLKLQNVGGCPMPVCLEVSFKDGSREVHRLPAEIWIKNNETFIKEIRTDKEIRTVIIDPYAELPDINLENNHYPSEYRGEVIGRFGSEPEE